MFYSEGAEHVESELHDLPNSDVKSHYVVQNTTSKARGSGYDPRKSLKIECFEIDYGGIFTYKKQLSFCQSLFEF